MLRAVFEKKDLGRAPGESGALQRYLQRKTSLISRADSVFLGSETSHAPNVIMRISTMDTLSVNGLPRSLSRYEILRILRSFQLTYLASVLRLNPELRKLCVHASGSRSV